ncbi:MAG: 50S ribosomal protein L29 [Clostridia bacterium]|nr:50S ribosomal protein L29 [Clostridia bacterium]MBR4439772.1 50S ribosomal protein L29 [Clostridia bacterium]MBR5768727.1 50S ribosomal protein L29 [Clostridia bacterium]MBR5943021.1 50S ribosomal protein L29 [Clostridia bacterium]
MKNSKELKELSVLELNDQLKELKEELFNLRFQHATNQLTNPVRINLVKKDIARVKTVIREKEIAAAGGADK